MPNIENADLRQTAVFWKSSTLLDDFGSSQVIDPIEIKVRWEAAKGEGDKRRATVFVDREIPEGSVLWLGKLIELPSPPLKPKDLMQVVAYGEIPDVRNRSPRRTIDLVLLGTNLPKIV